MLLRVHHSPHFETIGCWICIAVRTYGRADLVFVRSPRRRSADGRPLLLSALVTPALGTGADPFPETTVPTEWTIFSHAVASTRRGQLPPVRASSESSRPPTETNRAGIGLRRTAVAVGIGETCHRATHDASFLTARDRIHSNHHHTLGVRREDDQDHAAGHASRRRRGDQMTHDVRARRLMRDPTTSRVAARRVPVDGASERRRESVLWRAFSSLVELDV